MDAAIMDGRDLSCGSDAGVQQVPHPVSLARLVMEKTAHVMLAGDGAERFAESMGIKLVPGEYFDTPERKRQWEEYKVSALMEYKGMTLAQAADEMICKRLEPNDGGMIAVDTKGNYAMPFSSSGMFRGVATSTGTFDVKIWK